RKEDTGQWLFETYQFQQWMKRDSSQVLLVHGIHFRAGKTFMSSIVIDYLLKQRHLNSDGVAYIYFGYKDQTQQRLLDIISIFTKQLL
ncbi:hypothetical protein K440DRAFT_500980, partial [Wilcoxina mikolae CBS 423.85]